LVDGLVVNNFGSNTVVSRNNTTNLNWFFSWSILVIPLGLRGFIGVTLLWCMCLSSIVADNLAEARLLRISTNLNIWFFTMRLSSELITFATIFGTILTITLCASQLLTVITPGAGALTITLILICIGLGLSSNISITSTISSIISTHLILHPVQHPIYTWFR
jgi:hypothetical protein